MNKQIISNSFIVFLLTGSTYLLSIVFSILFAKTFGTSKAADTYFLAMTIPQITHGITSAFFFTPVIYYGSKLFAHAKHKELHAYFFQNILISAIVSGILSIFVFLTAQEILNFFFPDTPVTLILIVTPLIVLFGIASVTNAILHLHKKFILPALLRGTALLGATLTLIAFADVNFVALGFSIGILCLLFLQTIFILKHRYISFSMKFDSELFKKSFKYALPLLLGSAFYYIARNAPLYFATRISEGAVATLSYTFTIYFAIPVLITEPVSTVLYPYLSDLAHKNDKTLRKKIKLTTALSFAFLIPLTMGAYFLAEPVITLLYQRGAFTQQDAEITGKVFSILALSIIPIAFRSLFHSFFYAVGRPWVHTISFAILSLFIALFTWILPLSLTMLAIIIVMANWLTLFMEGVLLAIMIRTRITRFKETF
ncbi:MAG: oligosaccharide flippase family protein [Candidatus Aenigmarchaeota archaeon]|nr:oligosaccharide flippase family protein [Candidatus Aenigmarchaeota archaeon]